MEKTNMTLNSLEIFHPTPVKTTPAMLFGHCDPGKVLVVDRHPHSRLMAVDQLEPQGYQVREVDGTSDILEDVLDDPPDLILLDTDLPADKSLEICHDLKQDRRTSPIPIILTTVTDNLDLRLRGQAAGAAQLLGKPLERAILLPEVERHIQQKRLQEGVEQLQQVLFLISQTVESRCSAGGSSELRLDQLAHDFGKYLKLSPWEISDLILAAHLHDIGMVAIPDHILLKRDKLTAEERKVIEQHVLIGEKIFAPMQSRRGVAQIVRHHHERWDGSGYPDGLQGQNIPRLAQVFQILDIYDALTRKRPYEKALTSAKALDAITEEAEKGWRNPELVAAFADFLCQRQSLESV